METPKFDPNKPFEVESPEMEAAPKFDSNQPFEEESSMAEQAPASSPSEVESFIQEASKGKSAAIPTAVAVEGLRSKASDLGQAALNRVGKLSPSDMQSITDQPELYSKSRSFQDLLDEFKNLGDATRQKGFNYAEQAKESLKGLGPIKGDDLISSLSRVGTAPMVDLPESELPQPKTNTDSFSQLESASKNKQALEAKLNSMLDSGIESAGMNEQINDVKKQLDNVNSQIQGLSRQAQKGLLNPSMPTLSDYTQATNFPEEILSANPDLKTKRIPKNYANILGEEVDFLKGGEMSAYDVGKKYIQRLQDAAKYNAVVPDEANKFKQEMARNISEELKSLPGAEDYAQNQSLSKKSIQAEEALREFGIGFDSEGNYKVTNPNKIQKIYKDGNQSEISRLQRLIENAQNIGYNPESSIDAAQMQQIDRFQTELPLASIKKRVAEAGDSKLASATRSVVGGALGGVPGAVAGTVAPSGTKLQELASLAKGSKAYKGLAKASKLAGPLAGLAVAGLSYNDARDRGLDVPESVGVTAGEVLNPIPFTDVTGAYMAGKKEYQNSGEILPTAAAAGGAFSKPLVEQAEKSAKGRAENIAQNYKMGKIVNSPEKIANLEDLYNKFKSMVGSKGAESTAQTIDKAINGDEDEKIKADFLIQQNPMLRNRLK
jgi:hypothetical protein